MILSCYFRFIKLSCFQIIPNFVIRGRYFGFIKSNFINLYPNFVI